VTNIHNCVESVLIHFNVPVNNIYIHQIHSYWWPLLQYTVITITRNCFIG